MSAPCSKERGRMRTHKTIGYRRQRRSQTFSSDVPNEKNPDFFTTRAEKGKGQHTHTGRSLAAQRGQLCQQCNLPYILIWIEAWGARHPGAWKPPNPDLVHILAARTRCWPKPPRSVHHERVGNGGLLRVVGCVQHNVDLRGDQFAQGNLCHQGSDVPVEHPLSRCSRQNTQNTHRALHTTFTLPAVRRLSHTTGTGWSKHPPSCAANCRGPQLRPHMVSSCPMQYNTHALPHTTTHLQCSRGTS